jgi:pimeloyl-ACP methyl ester carboxylesterase
MRAACFASVIAFLVTGCNLADQILLWPPHAPGEANGAPGVTRVTLRDGDRTVEVWAAGPENDARACALRFYGNGALAQWEIGEEAERLERVTMWGVNYPGYGGSDGPATLRGVASAALAAYDTLAASCAPKPVFVFGTSLGAAAALHVAARRDVRGLVLVNPPPLRRLVLERHGWWNLWLLAAPTALGIPPDFDAEDDARRCTAPALFVTSERDSIVPLPYQGLVIRAYGGPHDVILLPNADHNDAPDPAVAARLLAAVRHLVDP